MSQHFRFDASRSLTALAQDSTIVAVIEMSQTKWLVAALVPGRRGFTKNATLYSDTSGRFGLPQSEKMFWHDGGWLKKIGIAQDILHPSGVLLVAIKPHRLDGDGQCAR